MDSGILKTIEKSLGGEVELYKKFVSLVERSDEVELEKFISEVDDSDYSLSDWIRAFLEFDKWLSSQNYKKRNFSQILGYVHCCQMMNGEGVERPELQLVVFQCLTDFGFEAGTAIEES